MNKDAQGMFIPCLLPNFLCHLTIRGVSLTLYPPACLPLCLPSALLSMGTAPTTLVRMQRCVLSFTGRDNTTSLPV